LVGGGAQPSQARARNSRRFGPAACRGDTRLRSKAFACTHNGSRGPRPRAPRPANAPRPACPRARAPTPALKALEQQLPVVQDAEQPRRGARGKVGAAGMQARGAGRGRRSARWAHQARLRQQGALARPCHARPVGPMRLAGMGSKHSPQRTDFNNCYGFHPPLPCFAPSTQCYSLRRRPHLASGPSSFASTSSCARVIQKRSAAASHSTRRAAACSGAGRQQGRGAPFAGLQAGARRRGGQHEALTSERGQTPRLRVLTPTDRCLHSPWQGRPPPRPPHLLIEPLAHPALAQAQLRRQLRARGRAAGVLEAAVQPLGGGSGGGVRVVAVVGRRARSGVAAGRSQGRCACRRRSP
jgi:hypothetical protein